MVDFAHPRVDVTICGPERTLDLKDDILCVYELALADRLGLPGWTPGEFWQLLAGEYVPVDGFALSSAWTTGELIGYAFGSPGPAGEPAAYRFGGIAVHPEWQREGVGRVLHDALLHDRPEATARLSSRDGELPPAFARWGWVPDDAGGYTLTLP